MKKRCPALLLLVLLTGCDRDPITAAQEAVAETVVPAVVAVREVVEPVVPPPPPAIGPGECPAGVELIVEFEVVSRAYYEQRLQGVICPPAASGPTWGIGYDGGHQTRSRILGDWSIHPDVDRLAESSGVSGQTRCRPLVQSKMADIRTPLAMAEPVFAQSTLPEYDTRARRAFANGWESLTPCGRGALRSVVYNRGTGMVGDTRREMREIRDICVPAGDVQCVAAKIRAMTRVWRGTDIESGMTRRRHAEADLALMEGA